MPTRGRPARLSRDAVINAAEAVVRAEGSGALSMRRVARELGSSPMALYRHVHDKDDLLRHLLDRIGRQLQRPAQPADPHARVLTVGRAVHQWLIAHPWAIEVLSAHLMGWSTAWIADDIVAALIAGGLSAQEAARGYAVIWHHIVGELTVTHSLSAQRAAARSDQPVSKPGHELPTLAALEDAWPAIRAEDHFERGLSALVSGLLARP